MGRTVLRERMACPDDLEGSLLSVLGRVDLDPKAETTVLTIGVDDDASPRDKNITLLQRPFPHGSHGLTPTQCTSVRSTASAHRTTSKPAASTAAPSVSTV